MGDTAARLDILIDIQSKLAELLKTQRAISDAKHEAEGFGALLRQGLGIGTGMELARRGIETMKEALLGGVGEAMHLAREIKQNASDIGFSSEAYQVFKLELHEAGVEMGRLSMAVSAQTESLNAARQGAGAAYDAYRDLHLVASEIEALPADQRMLAVAKATFTAADQTKAFAAAGNILGSRNLPSLLGALKNLANEGYGAVAAEAIKAGKIMEESTADLLRQNQRQLEALKLRRTIATGEIMGFYTLLGQAAMDNPMGLLKSVFSFDTNGPRGTAAFLANYMPKPEPQPTTQAVKMAEEEEMILAQIARKQQSYNEAANSPVLTETERRRQLLVVLNQQATLYRQLNELKFADSTDLEIKAAMGTLTEAELNRYKQYVALLEKQAEIRNKTQANAAPKSDARRLNEQYAEFRGGKNSEGGALLSPIEGVTAGVQQWQMQVGTAGQQIAGAIQGTIGGAISTVSDGIVGLIEHTRTWGDVGLAAGEMFLRTLVQLGVQMAANWAFSKIISADEKKETATNTAAKAAEGGMKSIAQLGPIFGPLAFAAGLAAIFALLGGFRANGGDVEAGRPYVVGERRAELFVPDRDGTILPSVPSLAPSFRVSQPGIGKAFPMGRSDGAPPRIYVVGDMLDAQNLKRRMGWDRAIIETVMRYRGDILNA